MSTLQNNHNVKSETTWKSLSLIFAVVEMMSWRIPLRR